MLFIRQSLQRGRGALSAPRTPSRSSSARSFFSLAPHVIGPVPSENTCTKPLNTRLHFFGAIFHQHHKTQLVSNHLIKLLGLGVEEVVPGDGELVQRIACEVLKGVVVQEGSDAACNAGQVVELLERGCRSAVALAVALGRRSSRTIIPELLKIGNECSMAAVKDILKANPHLATDANLTKYVVETVLKSDAVFTNSAETLCELPMEVTVPSLLRVLHNGDEQRCRAAEEPLMAIARRSSGSTAFLKLVSRIVLEHKRATGQSFMAKGEPFEGAVDPLANPPPANPSEIGVGPLPNSPRQVVNIAVKSIKAWCEAVVEWEGLVGDVWAMLLDDPSEEFLVSVCSAVGPVAAKNCKRAAFLKNINNNLSTLTANPDKGGVFDQLAPFLILRPLPGSVLTDELLGYVKTVAKGKEYTGEARRISWEVLSKARPVESVVDCLLGDDTVSSNDEFRLRVFYICSVASMLLGETNAPQDAQCLLTNMRALSQAYQGSGLPPDSKTHLALADGFALSLAAAVKSAIKEPLDDYSPTVIASAVAYLRKSSSVPQWFANNIIEHCTTKVQTDSKHFSPQWLELLFNTVYSVQEGHLSQHLVPLSDLALRGIQQEGDKGVRAASLKLLAAILAKAGQALDDLPSSFLPSAAMALTAIAKDHSDPQISQLASQLLSMLIN